MFTPTLPPDMVLAYKRYQKDTETVLGWLAENATNAGYNINMDAAEMGKQPKLKGRARKLARDAAQKSPATCKQKYAYVVKTSDFVEMAKHASVPTSQA